MAELYSVHYLSLSDKNHSCFAYFSDYTLRKRLSVSGSNYCLKLEFGDAFTNCCYISYEPQPNNEVPENSIGFAPVFAQRVGLNDGDKVLVSTCNPKSVNTIYVLPKEKDDHEILITWKNVLEGNILNQVRVVTENQRLPVQVVGNVIIDLIIDNLEPKMTFGKLEKYTELIVLVEKDGKDASPTLPAKAMQNQVQDYMSKLYTKAKHIFSSESNSYSKNAQNEPENLVSNYFQYQLKESDEYCVIPLSSVKENILADTKNSYLIADGWKTSERVFGPCSYKNVVRIIKVLPNPDLNTKLVDKSERDEHEACIYAQIVSWGDKKRKALYCPHSFMQKHELRWGSTVRLEQVNFSNNFRIEKWCSWNEVLDKKKVHDLWSSMKEIKNNIIATINDNIKFNRCINILLTGNSGAGKSFLLDAIVEDLASDGLLCIKLDCKRLRGKKIENLGKIVKEKLSECGCDQPAVLVLDDLDSLTRHDEEESAYNKLYTDEVSSVFADCVSDYQKNNRIFVIAVCQKLSDLGRLSATRGSKLFQYICHVPEMSWSDKKSVLCSLFPCNTDDALLDQAASRTDGYNVQDLVDLVEKAELEVLVRREAGLDVGEGLRESDLAKALSKMTPLALRGVGLRTSLPHRWEDVGGMVEPKKVLMEVLKWPAKYPQVFQSCPLRHQSGILLYGAPGTGKTLLAGAVANHCGLNFIDVKGPELLSKYVGASEESVRNLFFRAQKARPCVLFFDEFDSLAPRRGHDSTGVTDRVVNQLLTQLDGVESLPGVWVLAATSRPDLLDPALLRPGRLDKFVHCDLPGKADRTTILAALSTKLCLSSDVDFDAIAEASIGYTGADLQAVLYTAQMSAAKQVNTQMNGQLIIKQIHLLEALGETKPSLTPSEETKYKKLYKAFLSSRGVHFFGGYSAKQQKVTLA